MTTKTITKNGVVSVIVPAYNAGLYLAEAVRSALVFDEVKEVLVVDDASKDNTREVALQLQQEDPRVHLLESTGINKGVSDARNRGMAAATGEFIAFLDADDLMVADRFNGLSFLLSHSDVDGVYGAVGTLYTDEKTQKEHAARMTLSGNRDDVTGMKLLISPEELYQALLYDEAGWIHLNGLLVRRERALREAGFATSLRLHQDTEWILRLAYSLRLVGHEWNKVVALRRVHRQNRVLSDDFKRGVYRRRLAELKLAYACSQGVARNYRVFLVREAAFTRARMRGKGVVSRLFQMVFLVWYTLGCFFGWQYGEKD